MGRPGRFGMPDSLFMPSIRQLPVPVSAFSTCRAAVSLQQLGHEVVETKLTKPEFYAGARVLNIGQSGSHASERQKRATFAAMELSRLRDSIQQKFNGLQKDLSHIIEEAIVDITVMEATERTSLEMTKASMAVSGMCMSTPLPEPVRLV